MKAPLFSYHDPRAIGDVVDLLARLDNAKLLAGGQSLMPMLNMRFVLPDHLIDLNRVEGLSFIREVDGALEIGGVERPRAPPVFAVVRGPPPPVGAGTCPVGPLPTRPPPAPR